MISSSETSYGDDDTKGCPTDPRVPSTPGIRQGSFPSPPGGHTAHPRGPPVLARVRHETHRESPEWPGDTEQPSTADSRAQPGRRAPHTNLGPPKRLATDTMTHKDRKSVSSSPSGTAPRFRVLSRNAGGLGISVSDALALESPALPTPIPKP